MNLFIYVLLLSLWTNSCLNTNQSDGSSTTVANHYQTEDNTFSGETTSSTGAKHVQSTETEIDNFRRRLLVIIIGITIIAFVFTCFCFLHYKCMSNEAPKAGTLKKEDVTAKSPRSSKISFSEYKIASPCSLEKQSMLSSRDKFSGPSSPENSSRPSRAEKLIRPSSPGKQCISSSTEKLNSLSSQEKSHKPSSPQKIFRSAHPGKSYRIRNLEKPHKLAHACKLGGQACSSYPNKAVRPPWPASLQYLVRPTKPSRSQKHILSPRRSSLQKLTKSPRHRNLKRSVSTVKAGMLSRPLLIKICQCYTEKWLVCRNSSETLFNISETKDRNAQNSPFPNEVKSFFKSFHEGDYRDNVSCDNVSSSDIMIYDSDESDKEITIICNIKCNEVIPKGIQNN
ncbi:uncharacterized protein CXorf66 homolog [Zalophus californianus]|uniref:Uncharacterized protein CXorf66 homolog n=1 Tax=Zalophus californianus TaxID=9704 RepID=A0A6J2ECX2_ZALCA|nr:uncharacterized protein CXorf66 homolog [Zalophus californianus]